MLKTIALFVSLLIPTIAMAEVEPLSTPSPNSGTITPSAITTGVGSFSGSVTASSVTALSGGIKLSTIGDKVTFDNARRWIKIDSAGTNPMTFSQHVGAGSGFLFGLDNDDAGADSLTTLVNITPTGTGIGTASPATKLHMSSGTQTIDGNVSPSLVVNTGDVRIGTAAATTVVNGAKVAIFDGTNSDITGGGKIQLGLYSSASDTTVDRGGLLGFGGITSLAGTQNPTHWGLIGGVRESATASNTAGALLFATPTNGNLSEEKLRIGSTGQATFQGTAGACLMFEDTDQAGWTECDFLNGVMTCSIDADGVCD